MGRRGVAWDRVFEGVCGCARWGGGIGVGETPAAPPTPWMEPLAKGPGPKPARRRPGRRTETRRDREAGGRVNTPRPRPAPLAPKRPQARAQPGPAPHPLPPFCPRPWAAYCRPPLAAPPETPCSPGGVGGWGGGRSAFGLVWGVSTVWKSKGAEGVRVLRLEGRERVQDPRLPGPGPRAPSPLSPSPSPGAPASTCARAAR